MVKDEHRGLYAGALALCGVVLASTVFWSEPRVDSAVISLETTDFGAIETATTAQSPAPERAEEWNYPTIPWRSYEDGLEQAANENKPAVLVLQAGWCLMCRDYQRLFEAPEVEQFAADYVFILADVDDRPDLQTRYDVDGDYIPRTFVLEPDGGLRLGAQGGFAGHRYYVDPYRAEALARLLESENRTESDPR